ncbi:MAG: DUF6055 domain-containing protein [Planctomycetota bacterium]
MVRSVASALVIALVSLLVASPLGAQAPKTVYWPAEFSAYPEVSLTRSAQSANFIVVWGTLSGTNPMAGPSGIQFDPQSILTQLESVYATYIGSLGFLDDTVGNLSQFKIIVVMNDTWSASPWTGWAFGSSYDGVIGAMWVHPGATLPNSWVLAHEFAHSLQAQAAIDHPGNGFINYEPAGFVWEAHAQFMAEHHFPTLLEATDFIRFFNTQHFHWSSTRHHYGATLFLRQIEDELGIQTVNDLWRMSIAGSEHPMTTLKRITGMTQAQLGDLVGRYARKNVNFDYGNGAEMRHTVQNELDRHLIARRFTNLVPMHGQEGAFKVPYYMAPQDYGYNIVRLEAEPGARSIHLTFHGKKNAPAGGAGYRFSFVAVSAGVARYGALHSAAGGQEVDVDFSFRPGEELYLVVAAAPAVHHDYVWEPGWPKIYRYPWEIRLAGARPVVDNHAGISGASHANGGGFVASTASVAPTVFVGPHAQVLGNANVTGNVRIEDEATVSHSASLSGNVILRDAAFTAWSTLSGNAILEESAYAFGTMGGTYSGGGDTEGDGGCVAGIYRQVAHPNNGRSPCDGLTNHPADVDVNPAFPEHVFSPRPTSGLVTVANGEDLAALATASTSFASSFFPVTNVNDGFHPASSTDITQGAYANFSGPLGGWNWVRYDWNSPVEIDSLDVYWWHNGTGIRRPRDAFVEYLDGGTWVSLGSVGNAANDWNTVPMSVTTRALRISMMSHTTTGIIEWRVHGRRIAPDSIAPTAPTGVVATAGNGQVALDWADNPEADLFHYSVLRAPAGTNAFVHLAGPLAASAFVDAQVVNGTSYDYVVVAHDLARNASPASTLVTATPLANGPEPLVALYRFEGTLLDGAGSHHASATGSVNYVAGRVGQALGFNGSSTWLALPAGSATLNDLTVATWVRWDGGGAWQRIFDFGNNTNQYAFLSPSSGNGKLRFAITTGGPGGEQGLETAPLVVGVWTHVAVTLSGNTGTLYVNGQVASQATITLDPAAFSPANLYLGKSQWPDPLLKGRLDDFRLYDHALSAAEILDLSLPRWK